MIDISFVVLCLSGLAVGKPFGYDEPEYDHYRGPPAPLNPDGTVAFTPEYESIRDEHGAFFDLEYNRIKNDVDVDADRVKHRTYDHDIELEGQYSTKHNGYNSKEDDGLYDPELYEKKYISQYDDGQYRAHLYEQDRQDSDRYTAPQYSQATANQPSYAPAPLNPDGTVAHTPEYSAIASSFITHHHARHRRSTERYQGPPAPLNQDFTVDYTPEVKHFNDAHFSAVASQFKRLQDTAALAAAHPDRTSPPSKDYNTQNNEHHNDLFAPHHQGLPLGRKKRSYTGPQESRSSRNHDNGQYRPHHLKNDDGQYRHHQYRHDDGQYRPHQHGHAGQYKPQLHQVVDYNTEPQRPAPYVPHPGAHHGGHSHVPH